ncbi:MAG: phytanoyl-CoA dioxygenase family protein [Planctomycetes bacterium]|nr:phytanoyl-CoA dioxygenase family protein [Planctomycetota bacterium]
MGESHMFFYRREFDRLEQEAGKQASQTGLMNLHHRHPWIWELVTHSNITDMVATLRGPDLLLLGTHFFCKQADFSEHFVAWHQDVTYWGLEPPKALTVWLAIDDADVENGCMRVIPGSHRGRLLPHGTAETSGNLLSVNQEIPRHLVEESRAVDLPLKSGWASIHDGLAIHGSNPNRSSRRRCGLTIRFTTPDVRQVSDVPGMGRWRPILVHGQDRYGHFELSAPPVAGAGGICSAMAPGRSADSVEMIPGVDFSVCS